ncbi:MAG: phosphatidylglycerophosphatase A, partial [Verrucomicrobia bacterium]|nr:phosphatidylglycerophosphatase A [Verrucomicrobiota bacterium]
VGVSVWRCGAAEKILKQKDPASVVLDEIIALPFCFFVWLGTEFLRTGRLLTLGEVFRLENGVMLVVGFLAFRFFDIAKPWPVRQSQSLPGGWGVTIDDVLAAGYVNLTWLLFFSLRKLAGS